MKKRVSPFLWLYPWMLYLFAGHTIAEVKAMAVEAISYELSNPSSKQTLQSPAELETAAGVVSYSYKTGLRVLPEMQNLIATFRWRNSSASPRYILQGRNENTGVALPGPESILLGKTEPQLLH